MPRPSLYSKPERVVIVLDEKEKKQWERAAKKARQTVTAFVQAAVREKIEAQYE